MKRTHGVKGDTDMKKITPLQIETANVKTGEIFENHDAYTLLFDNSNIQKGREVFFICELFMAQNFTYTDSDEMNIIAGVKRPGDKETPLSELLADQKFNGKLHAVAGEKALALQADIWSLLRSGEKILQSVNRLLYQKRRRRRKGTRQRSARNGCGGAVRKYADIP